MKNRLPKNTAPDKYSKGFSLLEIMITMVVMGLVAALVSPAIMSMAPDMSLKSASRDMYSKFQFVKIRAVKENRPLALVFDTINNQYIVCGDSGVDGKWSTCDDIIETISLSNDYSHGIKYGHGNVPAGNSADTPPAAFPADDVSYDIAVPVDPNVVVFNSRGFCNAGNVYLTHQDDTTAYTIGSRVSGVVQLMKWKGGAWE